MVKKESFLSEHTMPAAECLVEPGRRKDGTPALRCLACGNRCLIASGKSGACGVRFNENGKLLVPGGYVSGLQVDPIEKKPFYHVLPGQNALSFGMLGCNLHCSFCQNWISSQTTRDSSAISSANECDADRLVELALKNGAPMVTSTYNEPLITSEWAVEIFSRACEKGLLCGYVSNGHATHEVIDFLKPHMRMYKVDLKTFNKDNYRKLGGGLDNVLDSIAYIKEKGFWLEIVTLLVPDFNDSDQELNDMAQFIAGISTDIPWHVTAFHPNYKMNDRHRTHVADLMRAHEIGKSAGLDFVYTGNLPGQVGDCENTMCPSCNARLIQRTGFQVTENRIQDGKCPECGKVIPGVWEV